MADLSTKLQDQQIYPEFDSGNTGSTVTITLNVKSQRYTVDQVPTITFAGGTTGQEYIVRLACSEFLMEAAPLLFTNAVFLDDFTPNLKVYPNRTLIFYVTPLGTKYSVALKDDTVPLYVPSSNITDIAGEGLLNVAYVSGAPVVWGGADSSGGPTDLAFYGDGSAYSKIAIPESAKTLTGGKSFSVMGPTLPSSDSLFIVGLEASTGNAYVWGRSTDPNDGISVSGVFGNNANIIRSSSPVSVFGGRSFIATKAHISKVYAIEGSTGNLYAWGINNTGVLGTGSVINRSSPTSVLGGRSWSAIASSTNSAGALEASTGNAYAWGSNSSGVLGNQDTSSASSPVSVFGGRSFNKIVMNGSVVAAIEASTGNAYMWGANTNGVLGSNSAIASASSPVSVVGGRSWKWIAINASNNSTTYAVEGSTGYLWSWGNATTNALLDGTTTNRSSPVLAVSRSVIKVAGDKILDSNGQILAINNITMYGAYTRPLGFAKPYPLGRPWPTWSQFTASASGAFAIEADYAWCWGVNSSGQLGDGTTNDRFRPTSVLGGKSWSRISGQTTALAIEKTTGNAYTWGNNSSGQLGNNSILNASSPVSVFGGRSFTNVVVLSPGGFTSCFATEGNTGNVYSWGNGTSGLLGNSSTSNASSPVSVVGGRSYSSLVKGTGNSTMTAIEGSTGNLYAWGDASLGGLGNSQTGVSASSPVSVFGGRSYSILVAGGSSTVNTSYAIEGSTGNLYAWGHGAQGQLGNNTSVNASSPVSVLGGRSFKQVYVVGVGTSSVGVAALDGSTGFLYGWGAIPGERGTGAIRASSPILVQSKSYSSFVGGSGSGDPCYLYDGSTGGVYAWSTGTQALYLGDGLTNDATFRSTSVLTVVKQYNTKHTTSQRSVSEDRNILISGGTWTWTLATNTLSWNNMVVISGPGMPDTTISAGSAVLPWDGSMLVVTIDRNLAGGAGWTTPTVVISNKTTPLNDNQVVLARRIIDNVIVEAKP